MSTAYYATIEDIPGQHASIVCLTDASGEWSGAFRVELRHRADRYEEGYRLASLSAQSKGGRLERYSRA